MPFHKQKEYRGRDDFNEAWANMTRQIHMEMLAKPKPSQPWPNPKLIKLDPTAISRAALRYKPSKRIILMSQCRPQYRSEKYQPKEEYLVEPAALKFVITPRLLELSAPRKPHKRKRKRKSAKRKKKERMFLEHRASWLALRAAPRKIPKPRIWRGKRPTPAQIKAIEERAKEMAIPVSVTIKFILREHFDPYAVSRAALKAKASDRTKELAEPRELPEEAILDMNFKPFRVKKAALKYQPTERIKQLSVPFVRKIPPNLDLKEDPYSIPARALKARCSKRTKELAKPVRRD